LPILITSVCFRITDAVAASAEAAEKLGFATEIDAGTWDTDYQQVANANLAALEALFNKASGEARLPGGGWRGDVPGDGTRNGWA